MSVAVETTRQSDLVSLADRMGFLQLLRVSFAVVVMGSTLVAREVVGTDLELATVTLGYIAVTGLIELLRRTGRGRGIAVIGGMLLLDGIYLGWVMYVTGGTQSPLRWLAYLHVIAVTLLASYRSGLKVTIWHSLLYFVVFYAQAAGYLEVTEQTGILPGSGPIFRQLSVFNIVTLWLVAIATAAFSSVNERELRRRKTDLEALTRMAASLEEVVRRPSEVADYLLDTVTETFDFKRALVLGGPHGEMQLMAHKPGDADPVPVALDESVQAASEVRDVRLIKRFDPARDPGLDALLPTARNLVSAPLVADGQVLGLFVAEYAARFGARVERRVLAMVSQFVAHAALAMRNAWLREEIRRLAETDALTGLANRRIFQLTLDRELSRASRSGDPVTLLLLDIDFFKDLNDTRGHQVGDQMLQVIADVLRSGCRDFDTPARYGGEEFAIILPGCSAAESHSAGDRFRLGVAGIREPAPATASLGAATYPVTAVTAEELLKAADEALYESKRGGRNRVTVSQRSARIAPAAS